MIPARVISMENIVNGYGFSFILSNMLASLFIHIVLQYKKSTTAGCKRYSTLGIKLRREWGKIAYAGNG